MLASEYGGGPRVILDEVYLDEAIPLLDHIQRRRLENYKMQVMIAHAEKPQDLIKEIDNLIREPKEHKFDSGGFAALKFAMSQNPRMIVK